MNHNISISPEVDQKILEEFCLKSEPALRKLLNTVKEEEHELYVNLPADNTQFVTEILGIDWPNKWIWLGTPYDKTLRNRCNSSTEYIIVTFPDAVKIQFSGVSIVQAHYQNADALRITIPKSLIRLQRRNYFRIIGDEELNARVQMDIPNYPNKLTLLDMSMEGCGFTVQASSSPYKIGEIIKDVRLTLPDGKGSMLMKLTICSINPTQDDPDIFLLGCEMKTLDRDAERRLQRFLLATERRQRANHHTVE
jgi:c-di-GMP-binding flagellar brake protein YcgR